SNCTEGRVLMGAAVKTALAVMFFTGAFELLGASIPALTGPVVDQANVLDRASEQRMVDIIRRLYRAGSGPQLQVLTVPSLDGESIEGYSIKVVDQWKLGHETRDDGVLFLLAVN